MLGGAHPGRGGADCLGTGRGRGVPQHRAALEELIRQQTGLNVSFSELGVRWGWYGPEAVFHGVVLAEPAGRGALLRAPQLIVGLDTWRMVRSGRLEAGRITLVDPDIDLGAGADLAGARAGGAGHEPVLSAGARLLSAGGMDGSTSRVERCAGPSPEHRSPSR